MPTVSYALVLWWYMIGHWMFNQNLFVLFCLANVQWQTIIFQLVRTCTVPVCFGTWFPLTCPLTWWLWVKCHVWLLAGTNLMLKQYIVIHIMTLVSHDKYSTRFTWQIQHSACICHSTLPLMLYFPVITNQWWYIVYLVITNCYNQVRDFQ